MKYLLFLYLIISPTLSHAKCDKDVQYVKEGNKVECDGYLFTPEKEQEVRLKTQSFNKVVEYSEVQDKLIDVLNKRVILAQEQNLYLSDRLNQEKNSNFYQNFLYFGLGVVSTALVVDYVDRR